MRISVISRVELGRGDAVLGEPPLLGLDHGEAAAPLAGLDDRDQLDQLGAFGDLAARRLGGDEGRRALGRARSARAGG